MKRLAIRLASRIVPALVLAGTIFLVVKLQNEPAAAALVGVLGVGTGFAIQGIVQNAMAGLLLMSEQPFGPGELLAFGIGAPIAGAYRRTHVRTTVLDGPDGSRVLVPNTQIFTSTVVVLPANWNPSATPPVAVAAPTGLPSEAPCTPSKTS